MKKLVYLFPLFLTFSGVLIHLFGMIGVGFGETPFWLHSIMFFVDLTVVVGLLSKALWGIMLGIILYIEQVTLQTYMLARNGWLQTSLLLVPLLCLAALVCLLIQLQEIVCES